MTKVAMWPLIFFFIILFFIFVNLERLVACGAEWLCTGLALSSSQSALLGHFRLHWARCLWSKPQTVALHQPRAGVSTRWQTTKAAFLPARFKCPV